ncbi:MAG: hypothetical protein PSY14_06845 [bacterium]|nr:hypothetical protein [bacterium]
MTATVIAFPNANYEPFICRPLYTIKWVTNSGVECSKSTRDADVVKRQLDSCKRLRLSATVRAEGKLCGGVLDMNMPEGRTFSCHFEGKSWA